MLFRAVIVTIYIKIKSFGSGCVKVNIYLFKIIFLVILYLLKDTFVEYNLGLDYRHGANILNYRIVSKDTVNEQYEIAN